MYMLCLSSRAFYSSKCFVPIYNSGIVAYPFSHSLYCATFSWLGYFLFRLECLELSRIWALCEHIVVSNSWFFLRRRQSIVSFSFWNLFPFWLSPFFNATPCSPARPVCMWQHVGRWYLNSGTLASPDIIWSSVFSFLRLAVNVDRFPTGWMVSSTPRLPLRHLSKRCFRLPTALLPLLRVNV